MVAVSAHQCPLADDFAFPTAPTAPLPGVDYRSHQLHCLAIKLCEPQGRAESESWMLRLHGPWGLSGQLPHLPGSALRSPCPGVLLKRLWRGPWQRRVAPGSSSLSAVPFLPPEVLGRWVLCTTQARQSRVGSALEQDSWARPSFIVASRDLGQTLSPGCKEPNAEQIMLSHACPCFCCCC